LIDAKNKGVTVANITPSELRRHLEEQGFRVKDVDGQTWEIMAPPGVNLSTLTIPSGIVRVHHRGLRREDSRWTAIIGDLKKIGFDLNWVAPKTSNGQAQTDEDIERQTGLKMYQREAPPDDPDDRWMTFPEAGSEVGISGSGVAQRVKAHGLRTVKLPVERNAFNGTRTIQVLHVNLKELKASGEQRAPTVRRVATPVRSRFDTSTAAGRLSDAAARARSALRKLEAAAEEFKAAADTIEAESGAALQELRDLRQRQKEIEAATERLVSKL
jgi:hypothetical protein